eukprot:305300_1
MFKLLNLILSLSHVLGSRQGDTLSNCNYVADTNPNDGSYLGWYAINKASPKDYCNYYQIYSDNTAQATIVTTVADSDPNTPPQLTDPPFNGTIAWWYECNANGEVEKYFCYGGPNGNTDCNTCTPVKVNTYDSTSGIDYNCGDVSGECLFEWTMWLDINDDTNAPKCNPDKSKILRKAYQVNGGCQPQGQDQQGNQQYGLMVCNDPPVIDNNGDSFGFTNEQYTENTCRYGGTNYEQMVIRDNTVNENACGMGSGFPWGINGINNNFISGVFEVDQCTGTVEEGPNYNTNGYIDNLGTSCDNCMNVLDDCATNSTCETLIDWLLYKLPNCTQTFEEIETSIIDGLWCNESRLDIPCDAVGFTAAYQCIKDEGCYTQLEPSNECDCSFDPCETDQTCTYATSVLEFDNNPNIFTDIFNICNAPTLPDGNATDCTVFKDFMTCHSGCDNDSDDDGDCMGNSTTLMFECIFTAECFMPFNATLSGFFQNCDDNLCSPRDLKTKKNDYCSNNACNDLTFNMLYNATIDCVYSECVWKNCEGDMNACIDDNICKEELQFVIDIEDKYDTGGDDDFMGMIKDRYCAKRTGGACSTLLDTAYDCVTTGSCLDLGHDTCWELNCGTQVENCNNNDNCIDTLINIIGFQTECERNISNFGAQQGSLLQNCPKRCNDLDITHYSECGQAMWHQIGPGPDDYELIGDPSTQLPLYYNCKEECKICDNWLTVGREGCGNGECGTDWSELITCVIQQCPDLDGDEDICFSQTCTDQAVTCLFDNNCYQDWQYVESYFDTIKDRQPPNLFLNTGTYEYEVCTEIYLTDDTRCGINYQYGDSYNCQQAAFQCYYYDIREYCHDTIQNGNGCSIDFWNMINCMFTCENDVITIVPTQSPTEAPTVCEIVSDVNSDHYSGWFVEVATEICEYCICENDMDDQGNNALINGVTKLICDKIEDKLDDNIGLQNAIVKKCKYECEFECLEQASLQACNCDGWKCGVCTGTTGGPKNPSNGNMFKIIGSVVLMLCIAVIY